LAAGRFCNGHQGAACRVEDDAVVMLVHARCP
jgi:hypothetical protein